MLRKVEVASIFLEDYRHIVGDEVVAEIRELARSLEEASSERSQPVTH